MDAVGHFATKLGDGPANADSVFSGDYLEIKRAIFTKLGNVRKNWKSRLFILYKSRDRYLIRYFDPADMAPCGTIMIDETTTVEIVLQNTRSSLLIHRPERTYMLRDAPIEVMREWCTALNDLVQFCKSRRRTMTVS
jgi:hypothetical protein